MKRPPHQVLGIPAGASKEDVGRAYRRLAHKLHPDKGGDPRAFQELQEAYNVLRQNTPKPSAIPEDVRAMMEVLDGFFTEEQIRQILNRMGY